MVGLNLFMKHIIMSWIEKNGIFILSVCVLQNDLINNNLKLSQE